MSKITALEMIDKMAEEYSSALGELDDRAAIMKAELRKVQRRELPAMKRAADRAAKAREELKRAVKASPSLFNKPKTRELHGIKLGFQKQKGKVVFADEEATIKLMKKDLPKDQLELVLRVRESVHKPSVYDLDARSCKRYGITIEDDTDEVYIKQAVSKIEKLIEGWLDDEEAA